MTELMINYNNAVNAYIQAFEQKHEIDFDFWVSNKPGEIAFFGDYSFNFSDIKYVIDNEIIFDYLIGWYDFILEFHEKAYINLDSYCRLRQAAEKNEYFTLAKFEKTILYNRIDG